ncbi:bifunctional diguanylate cyclase/phosphodiesterase [Paenibacillus sp. YPG26]|uniref:putative bifunctional diguanylate cyclase/phosphodiesterase n=1 Tax=Paenibacillus sp. YPG26 TaxID=2878915 RepID=UPI00203F5FAC|nr:bifunctional diguanylate cyclase/phosphodiesterase [Paenibacillus sp. YPG26]USB34359.1 EAL domain-containing protein [Paenibacillus sp. YPG26]
MHHNVLQGHYNYWMVLLSFIIAMFSSYSALTLAAKISHARGRTQLGWLIAGSSVMGCGVWAMHFIGMLAYDLNLQVTYDAGITILSLIFMILASYIAFRITLPTKVRTRNLAIGGFCIGGGIVAMHYTGMAAMRMGGEMAYDPLYWTLSAIIALTASYASLYLFLKFRNRSSASLAKWTSAFIMALAICGMHYTGMKATIFTSNHIGDGAVPNSDTDMQIKLLLLIGVSAAVVVVLSISSLAIYFDRRTMRGMAYTDELTGLPNRYRMNQFFDEYDFQAPDSQMALLFVDLDRFKNVNDTLGHDYGDMLVRAVGDRLRKTLNQSEIYRLGGDEFLCALSGVGQAEAEQWAKVLLEEIQKPFIIDGYELYITSSIGVSLAPLHGQDRHALLKAADTAMYKAKEEGKNRYRVFDESLDRGRIRRLGLENDLRRAVHNEEFFVLYQPKWNAASGKAAGMEALIRWRHPKLGVISPAEFIPIAEETGLIIPMTRWIMKEACRQNQEWQQEGFEPQCVSVNLSVRVFESQDLLDMIQSALAKTGLASQYLEVEITESILASDFQGIINQLMKIRELGIKIAMDDFGSGYSSLGSLDKLPIDTLKIDQLFVREYESGSKKAIIQAIITLGQQLNLELVAEGVETIEQSEFLNCLGCSIMQGYYYGKPMNEDQIREWLSHTRVSGSIGTQV